MISMKNSIFAYGYNLRVRGITKKRTVNYRCLDEVKIVAHVDDNGQR